MIFNRRQGWIIIVLMLLIILSTTLMGCIKEKEEKYILSPAVNTVEILEENDKMKESLKDIIEVHIKGEVNRPGVYRLSKDARLHELVDEAGGLTEKADTKNINLAIILRDEGDIYIPAIGEVLEIPQQTPIQSNMDNKVRINHASREELKRLPGIGDAIAERIIDYRNQKGSFRAIEEIKNVNGIGDKKFEDIKEKITVN